MTETARRNPTGRFSLRHPRGPEGSGQEIRNRSARERGHGDEFFPAFAAHAKVLEPDRAVTQSEDLFLALHVDGTEVVVVPNREQHTSWLQKTRSESAGLALYS